MSPPVSVVTIHAAELTDLAARLFVSAGVHPAEAAVVAESLVDSNLRGHESHGVVRVMEYLDALAKGELRSGVPLEILSATPVAFVCDGHFGFGQVQMRRLIELLEQPAHEFGIACGTVRRCGHIGRLGEWTERLAERGLAGLLSVNDNGVLTCVAPPGGVQPVISTNPIAIGVPLCDDALVLDVSTSMVANGKLRVARLAGQSVPDGWLIDASGAPTNDPNARLTNPPGTILPMGDYKGFGLGLLFDMLVGGLSGGCCPPAPAGEVECNNVMLTVFDPARFAGRRHFEQQAQGLADLARSAQRKAGVDSIRLPNDRSRETRAARLKAGIPLDHGTWSELMERAEQSGVRPAMLASPTSE